jgi:hypothetical protein
MIERRVIRHEVEHQPQIAPAEAVAKTGKRRIAAER